MARHCLVSCMGTRLQDEKRRISWNDSIRRTQILPVLPPLSSQLRLHGKK
jgi:hypothetical protein